MPSASSRKPRSIAISALRILLSAIFLLVGSAKLTGRANTVGYFAAIGWGQWFRYLTGFLDIAGAVLIWVPRWAGYGAVVLACSVGSAALLSLTVLRGKANFGAPAMAMIPLVVTVLALALAWLLRR